MTIYHLFAFVSRKKPSVFGERAASLGPREWILSPVILSEPEGVKRLRASRKIPTIYPIAMPIQGVLPRSFVTLGAWPPCRPAARKRWRASVIAPPLHKIKEDTRRGAGCRGFSCLRRKSRHLWRRRKLIRDVSIKIRGMAYSRKCCW